MSTHVAEQTLHASLDVCRRRFENKFRLEGCFVRSANSGERFNFASPRLTVEPFGIASLTNLERRRNVDFVKQFAGNRAHTVAVGAIWRDEGRNHKATRLRKELGDLADTADILRAIRGRKSQIGTQSVTNVVSVENERAPAFLKQKPVQLECQRRLSRRRQTSEPEYSTCLLYTS